MVQFSLTIPRSFVKAKTDYPIKKPSLSFYYPEIIKGSFKARFCW
jgi:hypothetical protein